MSYLEKYKNFFQLFILIDLLFFPLLKLYTIPISFFVVLYFVLKKIFSDGIIFNNDFFLILILSITLIISLYLSYVSLNTFNLQNYKNNNLRIIQIFVGLIYFIYFFNSAKVKNLELIFFIFFLYILIISLVYIFSKDFYFLFKSFFHHSFSGQHSNPENFKHARFSYFFQNPNIFAYFILSIFGYYFLILKKKKFQLFLFLITLFLVYLTESRGGMLSIFLMIGYFVISSNKEIINKKILILTSLIVILILLILFNLTDDNSRFALQNFLDAIDKRSYVYKVFLINNNLHPELFESGMMNTGIVGSHSDLLNILFSYGIVFALFFSVFVFKDLFFFRMEFMFLVPISLAFLIDSFMFDNKIFLMSMSLLGISRKYFYDNK